MIYKLKNKPSKDGTQERRKEGRDERINIEIRKKRKVILYEC
jgi:hypothetical protein